MSSSTVSKLDGLSGLEGAKRLVHRLATTDTGVHAVLLYGAEGSGKTELANALAQVWLCKQVGPEGACGECQACASFERGRCPDILNIEPAQPSNIIRAAAIVAPAKPDDDYHTALLDFFRTPPLSARHKVAIITDADRMNSTAANAFLKTLEEPFPFAKMVLTTSNIGAVLPTIISRCLAVACELPSASGSLDAVSVLSERAPGRKKLIEEHRDAYTRFYEIARGLDREPSIRALALADEFRGAVEVLEKRIGGGMRSANVEALRAFGTCVAELHRREDWLALIAEAHRRILGNGGAGVVLDAMFAEMLAVRPA